MAATLSIGAVEQPVTQRHALDALGASGQLLCGDHGREVGIEGVPLRDAER